MSEPVCGCGPILCAHLLRPVDAALLELLRSLDAAGWGRPTVVPGWTVREVAAHLLDGALRKLSIVRDGCPGEGAPVPDVVALVNRLNREGVQIYSRLSRSLLIEMLDLVCRQFADFHEALDPFAPAAFSVSWAGEERSLNWFDTARELTERWHHQQQIRLATGHPGLLTREFYHPVLDCFLRGLPHLYRDVAAVAGEVVRVEIAGDCGGCWQLKRVAGGWQFSGAEEAAAAARVVIPQELAWRMFTSAPGATRSTKEVGLSGDRRLGEPVLRLTAIVA